MRSAAVVRRSCAVEPRDTERERRHEQASARICAPCSTFPLTEIGCPGLDKLFDVLTDSKPVIGPISARLLDETN